MFTFVAFSFRSVFTSMCLIFIVIILYVFVNVFIVVLFLKFFIICVVVIDVGVCFVGFSVFNRIFIGVFAIVSMRLSCSSFNIFI